MMANALLLIGTLLLAMGLALFVGERMGLGRLPGDIVIEREGTRICIPLATSLVISVLLSGLLWLVGR